MFQKLWFAWDMHKLQLMAMRICWNMRGSCRGAVIGPYNTPILAFTLLRVCDSLSVVKVHHASTPSNSYSRGRYSVILTSQSICHWYKCEPFGTAEWRKPFGLTIETKRKLITAISISSPLVCVECWSIGCPTCIQRPNNPQRANITGDCTSAN